MKSILNFLVLLSGLLLANFAPAETPHEQLQQMVEQLQKSPNDNALREKIIKLAAEIKPQPTVPPEAKRPFVMAGTYQKEAKNPTDFALAITAYQDALKIAPWWGDAYYNLSVSLESAGRLDEAKGALELYLLTKPKDAEEVQNRLYALDAKKTLAAKQAVDAALLKKKEEKLRTTEGLWYGPDGANTTQIRVVIQQDGRFEAQFVTGEGSCMRNLKATATTIGWGYLSTDSRDNSCFGSEDPKTQCQLIGETTLDCQVKVTIQPRWNTSFRLNRR
jgi:tetratricopeptide (TPR) repeat protein